MIKQEGFKKSLIDVDNQKIYDETCSHQNEVIDEREGIYVCISCGLVKDYLFSDGIFSFEDMNKSSTAHTFDDVENFLHQLHIPKYFSPIVKYNLSNKTSMKNTTSSLKISSNRSSFNHTKTKSVNVKKIVSEIYNAVNTNNSNILLKDLANFSHLQPHQIKSKDILIVNLMNVLEKYTTRFNLIFKECAVIKEKISQFNNTGYQPLTVIGGLIYLYLIKFKNKIPMLKIASILGISSISIQRFTKKYHNAFSPRC